MSRATKSKTLPACAVLLAGGRGTRFWPRSRVRTPKQLLNITGGDTLLRETVARLTPVFPPRNCWVVTNSEQAASVRREIPRVPAAHILAEPVGRNTAAAIALAAIHLAHEHGDALMAVLSSDAHIANAAHYRHLLRAALQHASNPGQLVVMGIPPTRAETGYGYIERGEKDANATSSAEIFGVHRFTEKPALQVAQEYIASGKYFWNAGMFFWRVSTFLDLLKSFLPSTHAALSELAKTIGTRKYPTALKRIYPHLENISVDYAIVEPAAKSSGWQAPASVLSATPRVSVIPADIGWSDIGSWDAVYQLLSKPGANFSAGPSLSLDASGNFLWAPKKFVAALGVSDLVLVETDDAILICPRERSQDVAQIVKTLEAEKRKSLL
jgi:mannose-1-phosphate guanylyltransferase